MRRPLCLECITGQVFISSLFFALATTDGPGMMYFNCLVGYHDKQGCHLYCSIMGQHKPGGSHYYPALLKPFNYVINGCNHSNILYAPLPFCSPDIYFDNLRYLMAAKNENQYKKCHLVTGILKPSIFLGLQPLQKSFPILAQTSCIWWHSTFLIF